MTEAKYQKIISDLFRLTGYATGIISGLNFEHKPELIRETLDYLEREQKLILMELVEKD